MRAAVILAAGLGTRMRSGRAKVLHEVGGRPLVSWIAKAVDPLVDRKVVVIGHEREAVRAALGGEAVRFAVQEPQHGTGHAVTCAAGELTGVATLLILPGDAPRLRTSTLEALLAEHERRGARATVLTFEAADPSGYGRVIRAADGTVKAIVEQRDASPEVAQVREVNSGAYAFDAPTLLALLPRLPRRDNGEIYLTDAVALLAETDVIAAVPAPESEAMGINTQAQLAQAEACYRRERAEALLESGVTLVDPASAWIDADATIEPGAVLGPCVSIERRSRVGARSRVGPFVRLVDVVVGEGAHVRGPLALVGAIVAPGAVVGALGS